MNGIEHGEPSRECRALTWRPVKTERFRFAHAAENRPFNGCYHSRRDGHEGGRSLGSAELRAQARDQRFQPVRRQQRTENERLHKWTTHVVHPRTTDVMSIRTVYLLARRVERDGVALVFVSTRETARFFTRSNGTPNTPHTVHTRNTSKTRFFTKTIL